jgi:signal transduction histidine kinase
MAVSHALVLTIVVVLLGGTLEFLLSRGLDRSATDGLEAAAQGQVERILEAGYALPPADADKPSGASIQLAVFAAPSGATVGEGVEVPSWLHRYPTDRTDIVVAGERVRVVTLPVLVDGRTVAWVSAGRSLLAEDELLHSVRLLLLVGGAIALALSLAAGWWLAGRAVEPVERAYEAQAGFAADASHEFRTPLTFIRSGVEVLAERDPKLGADVLADVDYLTGLTQRLLTLARSEGGTVTFERAPLDVASVCRSAVRRSLAVNATTLSAEGPEGVGAIGDPVALEAALDAVIENVHVHGGGRGEVMWRRDGTSSSIAIVDHGPGIPAEVVARAFERFFRADPSRGRDTGGAGLGLALARTLVEAQGGRMWLEPTEGSGLTVHLELPAHEPEQKLP